jgi:hypothetical protein
LTKGYNQSSFSSIHTFSPANEWFGDYQAFIALFGLKAGANQAATTVLLQGISLHFAWVHEDERFLKT